MDDRVDGGGIGDGGGKDGSKPDGTVVAPTSFGKSLGDDPCVPAASPNAPAWTTWGRCGARTGRSPIVSSQTGTIAKSKLVVQTQASLAIEGDPTFGLDGTIYVNAGYLSSLEPKTLAEKWSLGVEYTWAPVVGPDGMLYSSGGGTNTWLRARDPANGVNKWSRDFQKYLKPPVVLPDGHLAIVVSGSGMLDVRLIDSTNGNDIDTISVPGSGISPPMLTVVSSDGTMFLPAGGKVFAISIATRTVKWEAAVPFAALAFDERAQKLYVVARGSSTGKLKVGTIDPSNGTATFGPEIDGSGASAIALGEDGWVYFTVQGGTLVGYDTKTNATWEAATGAWQTQPTVGGDGTVYVGAHKQNGVSAMAFTKTGALRWDKLLSTKLTNSTRSGAMTSIAPSGHLVVEFPVNDMVFMLGP